MTTYLLLGGGGVFGLHMAKYLLSLPETRRVVNTGRSLVGDGAISVGLNDTRYAYTRVRIDDNGLLSYVAYHPTDFIINFAAQGESAASWTNSHAYFETNAVALARLVEQLISDKWAGKFIQIGTSELYGSVSKPADELAPLVPTSPYAASKAAADMYLQSVADHIRMNIVRPSNAYGPGQRLHRIIPRAVVCGLTGRRIPLNGGGQARKSYIHATDLARAVHIVAHHGVAGEIYNVGPPLPVTIRDIVEWIAASLDLEMAALVDETPARPGEDSQYWLDNSKVKALGWSQTISLHEAIEKMYGWVRMYRDELLSLSDSYTVTP